MRDRTTTLMIILTASIGLMSCASLDFPKRGFATRYFAGSYVQKSVTTTSDFTGQPFHPAIETYSGPARSSNANGPVSSTLARNLSTCETVARQRATDIAFQGFGDATQKSVFDNTYRDCINWRTNH